MEFERVQRRTTNLIPELKNLAYEERLRELQLPSLTHRRRQGDMIYAYKLITGQMNISKEDFLKISQLTTRDHHLKFCKEYASKYTSSQRIVEDWRKALPPAIVKSKSLITFKNQLDEYWDDVVCDTHF